MSLNVDVWAVMEFYVSQSDCGRMPAARRLGWQGMYCPFHADRVPSASIHAEKGLFHCFKCGVSGGGTTVVRWREGLDFADALDFIEGIPGACDGSLRVKPSQGRTLFGEKTVLSGQRTVFQAGSGT